jgi:ATP-dependent exoDNAse (exonuclease V) beta subunit
VLESNQIQDQAQRDRALDPAHSFIVQAPAGSGKTELLIQRYLTLLAQVEQPEAVVAITFTRKAAGEMRHRVIDALEQVNGPEPESAHERHTRTLARNVLTRDLEREWDLIDHPARLRIQTIDSLCNSLVGQMPWISRMGAAPRPDANISIGERHTRPWNCSKQRPAVQRIWAGSSPTWTTTSAP